MFEGTCHCERVKWSYAEPIESATACNCTLCRRYGALWAYGHVGEQVTISGETTAYGRGSRINGYHFCNSCGCIAYYLANNKDKKGRLRIAVNLRMATDPEKIASLPIDHFDGLDKFEDLPRDHRCVRDLWF